MSRLPRDVTIETADTTDAPSLVDAWIDLASDQRRYGSHLDPAENREVIHETMLQHIVADTALVARRRDRVIGFITFGTDSGRYQQDVSRGIIQNIYVRAEERDAGIGSALLAAAEAELESRGVDAVSLESMAANDAARRFYRRHGYTPHRIELEKPINGDVQNSNEG